MLLKLFVCLLFVSTVSPRSVGQNSDKYIVVLRAGSSMEDIERVKEEIVAQEQGDALTMGIEHINRLIPMVFATVSKETVMKIQELPEVSYVELDQEVHMLPLDVPQYNASKWLETDLGYYYTDRYGLDIMNKPAYECRNNIYNPPNDGTGTDIYILDTGINYDHVDFEGSDGKTRAQYGGFDAVDPRDGGWDCNGHGSHCAGTAGGVQSGVAKNANLWSVRVLGCTGSGSTAGIEKALDFVASVHEENKGKSGFVASIVSMSLGGGKSNSFNSQVNALVAKGVIVVTASGNDGSDACLSSPGSAGDNINVGAHSEPQEGSNRECTNPIESFSNWGTCVDVIAPGRDILSVDYSNNYGFTKYSGTSMACPHVAGAAALLMCQDKTLSPEGVRDKIKGVEAGDIDRSKVSKRVKDVSKSERLFVPTNP